MYESLHVLAIIMFCASKERLTVGQGGGVGAVVDDHLMHSLIYLIC